MTSNLTSSPHLCFPNRDSVRLDLSWTHYRALMRLDNESARLWYMQYGLIPLRWSGGRRSLTGVVNNACNDCCWVFRRFDHPPPSAYPSNEGEWV